MKSYAERLRQRQDYARKTMERFRQRYPMTEATCPVCGRVYMVRADVTVKAKRLRRETCSTMCMNKLVREEQSHVH